MRKEKLNSEKCKEKCSGEHLVSTRSSFVFMGIMAGNAEFYVE